MNGEKEDTLMRMWKLMSVIAALAVLTWLMVPAIRIWRDPGLRSHRHTFQSPDPMKRLTMVMDSKAPAKRTVLSMRVVSVDHRAAFWDRYRAMLIGSHWPPEERCPDWKSIRDRIQPERSEISRPFDKKLEADRVSLSL